MVNIPALTRRDASAIFLSPIAYVVTAFFLLLSGYFFWVIAINSQEASLRYVLDNIGMILVFVTPLLTMRLISEETRSGTIETLMTAPVTDFEVVFAKYLAAFVFLLVMIIPTVAYGFILCTLAEPNPDLGQMVAGYTGLILMGGMFLSIGLFFSSVTTNQIIAAVATLITLMLLSVLTYMADAASGVWRDVLEYVGAMGHLSSFQKGLIDTRDVVYFVSITVFFIFLTVRSLESRRWR